MQRVQSLVLVGVVFAFVGGARAEESPPSGETGTADSASTTESPPSEDTSTNAVEEGAESEEPSDFSTLSSSAAASSQAGSLETTEPNESLHDQQTRAEARREKHESETSPVEEPDKSYFFVGLMYRHVFVPTFMENIFFAESKPAQNPGAGAEFTYRKNNFEIVSSLWWQRYWVNGPFRAKGDPAPEIEIINSKLSVLYASATFLWSTPITDVFAIEYGVGVGIGYVIGNLYRTEAYPDSNGDSVPDGNSHFRKCLGPSNPPAGADGVPWCDPTVAGSGEKGGHFGVKGKRWSSGGNVPNVWPWISIPHLAIRIKPIRQVMMRIEGGFSTGGFFAGASAAYGI